MAEDEIEEWLREGITAVKTGDRDQAYRLFMQVIEVDDKNESAWLWLSSVVESEADERVCLENVLAINPDNAPAWRKLDALNNPAKQPAQKSPDPPTIEYRHREQFDDVWSQNVEICGYCAARLKPVIKRCPDCKRKLIVKMHRYPAPSPNLMAVWTSLIFISLLFAVQFGYSRVFSGNMTSALTAALIVIVLLIAAVGSYFRQAWAYGLAIITLVLIIITGIIQLFFLPDATPFELVRLDPAIRGVYEPITNAVWLGIIIVQIIAASVVLVFAFRASGDFERVGYRQIAVVSRNLKRGIEYHTAARKLAEAGLWATAVKHWQRAVALEPNHIGYQKHLGNAYARLGFKERSLDVLQSAKNRTKNKEAIIELEAMIKAVASNKQPATGRW